MENSQYKLRNRKIICSEYNSSVFLCVFLSVTLGLLTALILFVGPDQNDVYASSTDDESRGTCREIGYSDGRNGDFDHGIFNDGCDDVYSDGFIDGCMNAGNTRDVCESATDA